MKRAIVAFGRFWWDFLVGDTPEFAVATVVIVALAYAVQRERTVGVILLPVVALGSVALSAAWARRRARSKS